MKKIQSKGWIVGIIIFINILLIGSITFIVLVKQRNMRTPLKEGEQYMEDILPNKTPSEIVLH